MGVEKQRKKEEDPESAFTLRSQPFDVDESGTPFLFFYFLFLIFFPSTFLFIFFLFRIFIVTLCFLCNLGSDNKFFFTQNIKKEEKFKVIDFECLIHTLYLFIYICICRQKVRTGSAALPSFNIK